MPVLNNQVVADAYPVSSQGAILTNVYNSRGGWFSVLNATAFVQLEYGPQGSTRWTEEVLLGNGAFVVLPQNCVGVQFRNGVAGLNASVTAQIAQGDEPPLGVSAIGVVGVTAGSLNFQHNDVAVATEPTLDFEDAAGGTNLIWGVVNDAPSTRVKLTPTWANPTIFPNAISTGPTGFAAPTSTLGVFVGTDGSINSVTVNATTNFFTSVTGNGTDTSSRFILRSDGRLAWGPGNATQDSFLGRVTTGVIGSTNTAFTTGPSSSSPGGGQNGIFLTGGGGSALSIVSAAATISWSTATNAATQLTWQVTGDGTMKWGPGSTPADIVLSRQVSSPTGSGSFLELTLGAGLGYGTGTGGTLTTTNATPSTGTINKPSGQITSGISVPAATIQDYTITNSVVGVDDVVIVNLQNAGTTLTPFTLLVTNVGSGTFSFTYQNSSGGPLAPKFNFAVIKGAVA